MKRNFDSAYRIVVCVDVHAESLDDAYETVYKGMTESELDWESSDEWFDVDGYHGDPDTLQESRMRVFAKLNVA